MGIGIGAVKFVVSLIGGLGSILFFLGAFYLASTGKADFAIMGAILYIIGEASGLYLTKYESKKEIEIFQANILQTLGMTYAFPMLLFILYLFSPDKFLLVFTLALTAGAIIRTVAIIAKAVYIERNY